MELTLKILLGLVTMICFLGGMNLLIKGAHSFLPESARPQPVLDKLFRFLSGIYFGLGFLMAWVLFHVEEVGAKQAVLAHHKLIMLQSFILKNAILSCSCKHD